MGPDIEALRRRMQGAAPANPTAQVEPPADPRTEMARRFNIPIGSLPPLKAPEAPVAQAAAPTAPPPPAPGTVGVPDLQNQIDIARKTALGSPRPQGNYIGPQGIADMRKSFFEQRRGALGADIGAQKAQALQGVRAQQQEAGDALQRRFAALGQGGSGAAISAMGKLNEQGLDAQRAIEESVGRGQMENLNAAETEAQMQQAQNELTGGRQYDLAGLDENLKREIFGEEKADKLKAYDMALKQFELDKDTTAFNKRMAEITASQGGGGGGKSGGGFQSLLGPIGNITKAIGLDLGF